jgi:hypothetical protein
MLNYAGPTSEGEPFEIPFLALNPIAYNSSVVPWNLVSEENISGLDSQLCELGLRRNQYPVGMKALNAKSMRTAFEQFKETPTKHPEFKAASFIMYEVYADQGVVNVPADSTAYPHRSSKITT